MFSVFGEPGRPVGVSCYLFIRLDNLSVMSQASIWYIFFRYLFSVCCAGLLKFWFRNSPYNWTKASFFQYMTFCPTGRLKRNRLSGYEQTLHWYTFL